MVRYVTRQRLGGSSLKPPKQSRKGARDRVTLPQRGVISLSPSVYEQLDKPEAVVLLLDRFWGRPIGA